MFSKFLAVFFVLGLFLTLAVSSASAQTFNIGLTAQPGAERGSVQLNWFDNDTIGNYNLAYGPAANTHLYGVVGLGNSSNYLVKGLTPGQRYYFSLSPVINGQGLAYFGEVSAVAATTGGASAVPSAAASQSTIVALPSGNTGSPWFLSAITGTQTGEVKLTWTNTRQSDVNGFDLVYGSNGMVNEHGYQGIRQSGTNYTFVVGGLVSGRRYFFSILPEKDDKVVGDFSQAVSAVAR